MRFEELSKEHQEFLMYSLLNHIKRRVKQEGITQFIDLTYNEYKDFFNEFDEDYEIIDDSPESKACNRFLVKFKVVLEVEK